MYLALRDIRFATGRFALMGGAVALISVLLVMLSGLTAGLARQNTSAIAALDADAVAFSIADQDEASYTVSRVTEEQVSAWRGTDGVAAAEPLGISQTRVEPADGSGTAASAAVFGAAPDGALAPGELESTGEAVIGEELAAELDIAAGDALQVGSVELEVTGVIADQWYSHTPVIWTSGADWVDLAHLGDDAVGTVVAASFDAGADAEAVGASADDVAATTSMTPEDSFGALASYSSENGSLSLIQGLLYGISALVIVAFLTVWTVQRTRDVAVLKALGASNGYVLRDALGQAFVVLLAGGALGALIGWAGGAFAGRAVPFVVSALTTVLPAAGVVLIGLAGAALAVRRVTKVDPLLALGGS